MVAPALLSFSGAYEQGHSLKYFVHAPHVFVQEVVVMDLQEPVIPLVLIQGPVAGLLVGVYHL